MGGELEFKQCLVARIAHGSGLAERTITVPWLLAMRYSLALLRSPLPVQLKADLGARPTGIRSSGSCPVGVRL